MRKWLISLLSLALLAYLALCALMYFKQREMIYFPQLTRVSADETNFSLELADVTLRGWSAHEGERNAVLYFGGNAEDLRGMHRALDQSLPRHAIYLLAYRGYGASEGAPQEDLLFADAVALFDHVRAAHPDGHVSVIGRSLGSGVASYVTSQRDVHRLVLVTPFDSLVGVGRMHYPWLPVDWLATERYHSDRFLSKYRGPALILRAGRDTVVPPASTDRLIASLPRPPEVINVPAATHDSILSQADESMAMAEFLTR